VRRAGDGTWLRAMPWVFVIIWSTGFVVARLAMPHAPPLRFLVLRYAISVLCFGLWVALARPAWPRSRAQWLHQAAAGVLMHGGYLGGVWSAIKAGAGAGIVALLVGLQPLLTALWLALTLAYVDPPGVHPSGAVLGLLSAAAPVVALVLWVVLEHLPRTRPARPPIELEAAAGEASADLPPLATSTSGSRS